MIGSKLPTLHFCSKPPLPQKGVFSDFLQMMPQNASFSLLTGQNLPVPWEEANCLACMLTVLEMACPDIVAACSSVLSEQLVLFLLLGTVPPPWSTKAVDIQQRHIRIIVPIVCTLLVMLLVTAVVCYVFSRRRLSAAQHQSTGADQLLASSLQ